jgi:ATP-binding cassette subfamily C (CFTR/MRP) protein 1
MFLIRAEHEQEESDAVTKLPIIHQPQAEISKTKNFESTSADRGVNMGNGRALMTIEERKTGAINPKLIFYYFNAMGSCWIPLFVMIVNPLYQGIRMVNDYFLSGWTSNAYNLSLSGYTTGYSVLFALFILITFGVCVSSALATYQAACGLHDSSFFSLIRAPVFFFDTTPLGRILNRFSRDQDVIDNQLGDYFRMTINTGVGAVFTFILLAIVSPYFLIPFVPCVDEFMR